VDPVTGGVRTLGRTDGFLTAPSGADPAAIALDYVRAHDDAFGLDPADLATLRPAARQTSSDGVTHLVWSQSTGGVPAYDSALTAAVAADGRLLNVGGAPVHDLAPPSTDPPLGPGAVRSAAQRDLGLTPDGDPGTEAADPQRTTTFADGDDARLVTVADPGGDHLAWSLTVAGTDPYVYDVLVDAASGAILTRHSITDFAFSADVVQYHPGASTGGSATPATTLPAGWFSSSTPTSLTGPNAHVYADRNGDNTPDAETPPSGGTDFLYPVAPQTAASGQHCPTIFTTPCTWNGTGTTIADGNGGTFRAPSPANATVAANVNQVNTQVFYYVNKYHDWLAQSPIGFTTYNFQGADPLKAESDDGGGLNNANMSTPADGSSPRMQMYLFNNDNGFPAVNGGDDATVVYHEYTHGLTSRLVGGDGAADGLQSKQSEAMGEGWSDWYALDFLTDTGYITDNPATPGDEVIGAYVTNNARTGIRFNAVDCPVGSSSLSCPGSASAGAGGFTYADLGDVCNNGAAYGHAEVHSDGEIWAETLWDLRTALGGLVTRGLVTNALRLSPKQPTFLDMRNAILQADLATGGTHRAAIWSVFAARGMGYSATTTSPNATRANAAFDTPPVAGAGAPSVASLPLERDTAVTIPIRNTGGAALTNVSATVSGAGGVTAPGASATLGTIAAGTSAPAAFVVHVPASIGCTAVAGLTVSVSSDQGTSTLPVSIPVGSGRATAATRIQSPVLAIPNGAPTSTIGTSTLALSTPGRVGALRVTLALTHSALGDLHAWLTSPSGTRVDLLETPGGDGGTLANVAAANPIVLDDAALTDIQDVTPFEGSVGGTFRPNQALAAFAGEPRAGTWTLRVVDQYSGTDTGSLASWSLETDDPACAITDGGDGSVADGLALSGRVDPGSSATSAAFEIGTTASYGGRSAPITLSSGGGLQSIASQLTGLAPGASYHVRAVALRGGVVVAAGADQVVVAGGDPQAPPAAITPPAAIAPVPKSVPPPILTVPKSTIKGIARTLRLDRKGRLVLRFTATPAKARSTLKVTAAGALAVGSKTFTVPASRKVALTIVLTKKAAASLRKHKSLKVKLAFHVGATSLSQTITIKPYKKKK
ncbi:MAG: peptidase fungalysin, partial [Conexibacter sp.]|nr:peptidase fungalysin [Conexibacter sp.]